MFFRISDAQIICASEDNWGIGGLSEEGAHWVENRNCITWSCGCDIVALQRGTITIWFGVSDYDFKGKNGVGSIFDEVKK